MAQSVYLWLFIWLLLLIYYFMSLLGFFNAAAADHVVYIAQLISDMAVGASSFFAYKKAVEKNTKNFFLFIFLSICIGLFANEVYNFLFNILQISKINASVNEIWILSYTLFLLLQIITWIKLIRNNTDSRETKWQGKWFLQFSFLQAGAMILLSIIFTDALRKIFTNMYGIIQITNTALEIILFMVLSFALSRAKKRSLIYLSFGFLLLISFNLAHRFSYMTGHFYKTFDIAWLISFIFIIFGFASFISSSSNSKLCFYRNRSFHVFSSSILTLATSILFLIFAVLEFFITSLEVGSYQQVKILIENMPSVLIFSFSIAVMGSKVIALYFTRPIDRMIGRIVLIQKRGDVYTDTKKEKYLIYEFEKLNRFFLKTLNKLSAANRVKSEFLMNMSHDFRTPASGICSMAKLVHSKIKDEKLKNLQKLIVNSSEKLLALLDGILDYTSLDSKTGKTASVKMDIRSVLDDIVSFVSAKAEEAKLTIFFDRPLEPMLYYGDQVVLHRIIVNLISNAIKFTPKGGIIIKTYPKKIQGKNIFIIKIKDSGIGIDSTYHDAIFDPFFRIKTGEPLASSGIGLGLSNVKLMLNKLGGKITVSSEVGKGSTFTVFLFSQV